jgi:hypothetical protein
MKQLEQKWDWRETYNREQKNSGWDGPATSCDWRTAELLHRLQNGTHRGRRRSRPVNAWKDGSRDSKQRRNLKDEECIDRELWWINIMSLGWRKLFIHRKIHIYIVTCWEFAWLVKRVLDLIIEFIGPLYNLLQHFTNRYLRVDPLDFWPHYTNPLLH